MFRNEGRDDTLLSAALHIHYITRRLPCQVPDHHHLIKRYSVAYHVKKGVVHMKDKLQVRSSFAAPSKEQLKQSVTKKIEKIANEKLKKAG